MRLREYLASWFGSPTGENIEAVPFPVSSLSSDGVAGWIHDRQRRFDRNHESIDSREMVRAYVQGLADRRARERLARQILPDLSEPWARKDHMRHLRYMGDVTIPANFVEEKPPSLTLEIVDDNDGKLGALKARIAEMEL